MSARIRAIERAARVLSGHRQMGLTEISREVLLGKSTTHRLLASLIHAGLVRTDARSRQYALGYGLLQLTADCLVKALHLETPPIGVLWTMKKPEGVQRLDRTLKGCQFLDVARLEGKLFYVDLENNRDCKTAATTWASHRRSTDSILAPGRPANFRIRDGVSSRRRWLSAATSSTTTSRHYWPSPWVRPISAPRMRLHGNVRPAPSSTDACHGSQPQ